MNIEILFETAVVPEAVKDAYLEYRVKPNCPIRSSLVTVEICKWANQLGVLMSENFDVAYGWHRLHNEWADQFESGPMIQ